jgi:hypothetical protein
MRGYIPDEVGDRLTLEATQCFQEGAVFARTKDGSVVVCVSEEQAVDSYNQSFTCNMTMTPEQAVQLRNWLVMQFPPSPTQPVDE